MAGNGWMWDGEQLRTREARGSRQLPEAGDVVLVLGDAPAPASSAHAILVLNGEARRFAALKRKELRERLLRIGITLSPGAGRHAEVSAMGGWRADRQIRVRVFQDQVLDMRWIRDGSGSAGQSGGKRGKGAYGVGRGAMLGDRAEPESLLPQQSAYRKASRAAIRSIYALCLDAGIVELSLDGGGRCVVDAVLLPSGAGDEWEAEAWLEAVEHLAAGRMAGTTARDRRKTILLGADPEFLLVNDSGKVVPAERYLGSGYGAGTDAMFIGGRIARPVAELRPAPAAQPSEVAARIRGLLSIAQSRIRDAGLRWVAGAMPVPGFALGGHIHVSGVPLTNRLLRQLDSYVAIPLAMAESEPGRARRPRFGVLGDCRQQPHGGFEYRTLPSWLVSPAACEAALSLALLCALETDDLDYCPAADERYMAAYYRGDRETLRTCLEPLITAIRAVPSYEDLAPGIEPFLQQLRDGAIWDEALDIRAAWSLPLGESGIAGELADIARPSNGRARGVNHRIDLL